MLISYFLMPAPPAPLLTLNLPVNIDYVYGFSDHAPQHWMPPLAFLGVMLLAMPVCIFLPTHLLLQKVCKSALTTQSQKPNMAWPSPTHQTDGCQRATRPLRKII